MSSKPNQTPRRETPLRFMGFEFPSATALREEFPAFGGEGPLRAIRAGCDTVEAVEAFDWKARKVAYAKSVAGAKKSGFSAGVAGKIKRSPAQAKAASLRGGLASARRAKA